MTGVQTCALPICLAAAKHKATVLEGDLKKTNGEKVALETKLAAIQASLGSTQQNLDHLTEQYKQAQSDLKVNDTQRKTLVNNVSKTSKALSSCEVKNIKLHEFGSALVHIYDKPSTYEAVLRTEPFAQTKRVELENIMQDYQDKLDEQRAVSATDIK